jgi:hypothetical protein
LFSAGLAFGKLLMESLMQQPSLARTCLAVGLAVLPTVAVAQVNGGFENGDLSSWSAPDGGVDVLQVTDFSPSVAVPEGSWFALLSTGPGGQGRPTGDIDANGRTEFDITTLQRTFTVGAGGTVSFEWAFLTSEQFEAAAYDDVFEVLIDDTPVLQRSVNKPGGDSPFPDTPTYDATGRIVNSTGDTDNSTFDNGTSGFSSFQIAIPTAGTYTITFRIADQTDSAFDSGLLIDDFVVGPPGSGISQITTTPRQALVESKAGGFTVRFVDNRNVRTAPDGTVQLFESTANLTGDNPSGHLQVFTWDGASFTRLTDMTDGTVSGGSAAASSRWVAYAATDDPLGTNPDLNLEVFRYDLVGAQWRQITFTTGCSNTLPSISDDGSRILFTTDCTNLVAGFNGDGNSEIAVWDVSLGLGGLETTGCSSGETELADDGSLGVFRSNCNPSGANADGNDEVFSWAPFAGSPSQITATSGAPNAAPSVSADGDIVAFLSQADLTGGNGDGSMEIFAWNGSSFEQLTDGTALDSQWAARVDASGGFIAGLALPLSTGQFEVFYVSRPGGTAVPVASGDVGWPDVALDGGQPALFFEGGEDLVGDNADGNTEIFRSTAVFSPPVDQCSAPFVTIPDNDNSGVSDDIIVSPGLSISDLNISLDISHTYVNDLVVTLEHVETGTTITLIDRITRDNGSACFRNDIDAILDDDGARDVGTECPNQTPTVLSPPSFIPEEALSTFDGESTSGTWRLTVSDRVSADVGTLNEWCVDFEAN